MNKRGDTTVWEELVKAIPAMMIVLLLIWAGVKIWNSAHPEQFSTEKKDLKRIVLEIKDLKPGDDIIIPLFSSSNYSIKVLKPNTNDKTVYSDCSKDYCVCFNKNNIPSVCESFDLDTKTFNKDNKGNDLGCTIFLMDHYITDASSTKNFKIIRDEKCNIQISSD